MLDDMDLARRLYDGELDSSFLQEPLPPPHHSLSEGAIDNRFKRLVDKIIMSQQLRRTENTEGDPQ